MSRRGILHLMRPDQWIKNCFVFLPIFFGGMLADSTCLVESLLAFFAFSLISSAVYCINDIADIEADRLHPEKCHRPVASGEVSTRQAGLLALLLISGSFIIIFNMTHREETAVVVMLYFALNLAYTIKLKHYCVIDVLIIAMGFVLRVVCGGVACGIRLSSWILLITFLITLFLALAKRRDDVMILERHNVMVRRNVKEYNNPFLNLILVILGGLTVFCYIMYTLDPEIQNRLKSRYIFISSIFVIVGIIRYLYITIAGSGSGNPTRVLLHDRVIMTCTLLWISFFFLFIY